MRRVLVPGGRVAAIVYGPARQERLLQRAGLDRPPPREARPPAARAARAVQPRGPGRRSKRRSRRAGFRDVKAETVAAPLRMKSAARVPALRAGVVRRAPPDALVARRRRPRRRVGGGRRGACASSSAAPRASSAPASSSSPSGRSDPPSDVFPSERPRVGGGRGCFM